MAEIPTAILAQVAELVASHSGLDLSKERHRDLRRALLQAADAAQCDSIDAYLKSLLESPDLRELQAIVDRLTIGETYFFREPGCLDVLRTDVLPDIIRRRRSTGRTLRILSAGCCTGEEPYSLAILLDREFPELRQWNVCILGADVNAAYLRRAERGIYSEWSFRATPGSLRDACFVRRAAGKFELRPEFRRHVAFAQLNLAQDWPSTVNGQSTNGFDLILCRNVLMYFSPQQLRLAMDRLRRALAPGGYLALGTCETPAWLAQGLQLVNFGRSTVARLPEAGHETASAPAPYSYFGYTRNEPRPTAAAGVLPDAPAARFTPEPTIAPAPKPRAVSPALDPERLAAIRDRVRELTNRRSFSEAQECIDDALRIQKLDALLHFLRATLLIEEGATGESMEALRRVIYLEPNFIMAHVTLGSLARRTGLATQAQRHLDCAARLLRRLPPDEVVPESDGLNARRLLGMVESINRIPRTSR